MPALSLSAIQAIITEKLGFSRLARKEKILVLAGCVFILVFVLVQLVFSPILQKRTYATNSLTRKQENLQQITRLQKEYKSYQKSAGDLKERINKRSPSFSLFSFIERQAATSQVKKRIKYMKPSSGEDGPLLESQVEMSLNAITLKELVKFLSLVESHENCVVIKRISIRENGKKEGYLNSIMKIVSYSFNESV